MTAFELFAIIAAVIILLTIGTLAAKVLTKLALGVIVLLVVLTGFSRYKVKHKGMSMRCLRCHVVEIKH